MQHMYPFWATILSLVLAQIVKPFLYYRKHKKWIPIIALASGGFPSSHTAMVSALALSVGIQESFTSTLFVVALALCIIVGYDAANVRYYSGQNIQITQQLIRDLQQEDIIQLDDPIYETKVKEVLGHKWTEVLGGIAVGITIALLLSLFR